MELSVHRTWMMAAAVPWLVVAVVGCNTAGNACEDFVDAVEECEGAADDYYNQAWCDETVDRGCEDRRYFNCLEDKLECTDGQASTRPILCEVKADATCPDS